MIEQRFPQETLSAMATKPAKQRTLHDHLSRLNLKRAEKLLGSEAKQLLGEGRRYEINIPQQVKLGRKRMRVRFPRAIDGKRTAVVTLDLSDHKRKRLQISCTPCEQDGELKGAVLNLILKGTSGNFFFGKQCVSHCSVGAVRDAPSSCFQKFPCV